MSRRTFPQIKAARRSNAKPKQALFDLETERQAKRLGRQQKKLEKTTGIAQLVSVNDPSYQRMIKQSDIKELVPLTDTQERFFESWAQNEADGYVLYGSAGTGKTFIALYHALMEVLAEDTYFHRIIIVRSTVQARDTGFLPGSAEEKLEPYEAVYQDIVSDLTGKKGAYEKLKDIGRIEFVSTSFLRGTTFNNAIVILDEAQNLNFPEVSTVITRIGSNSKIIVCGDSKQDDLHYKKNDVSGFKDFVDVSKRMGEFRNFRFTPDDIVRSGFVKSFLIVCEQLGL